MLGPQTNTTLVGRLRIRSKSSDPQAEQQSIARMLRSATLHPSGLPESATLVVRRLADPLPSRLRAGPFDLLPDASWQRAVAAALEKLAASAARPAYGAVPAEINAVLFYDRAEVLAALALDWMSGALPLQWWWRELLRGRDPATTLFREWTESPQYVPGALDLLARRARAVQFVQRLPEQAAGEILETVLRAYSVPRPGVEDKTPQKNSKDRAEPQQQVAASAKTQKSSHAMEALAPSLFWVPEASTPGLLPAQRMLLIQGLMLRRAPAVARTMAFQKDLLQWQARAASATVTEDRETEEAQQESLSCASQQNPAALELPEEVDAGQAPISGLRLASLPNAPAEHLPEEAVAAQQAVGTGNKNRSQQVRSGVVSSRQPAITDESSGVAEQAQLQPLDEQGIVLMQEPASAPAVRPKEAHLEQSPGPSTTLETEFGGVFFLLSLALYLYIYSDFTSPAEPGLELNIWDFLALMSTELTGGAIEHDPLWGELASLAGRPKSVRPGLGFDAPEEWRLPPEWLAPFSEGPVPQPALTNGRMISVHPAGFTVLDVPAETDAPGCSGGPRGPVDRLQRWVGWMTSYFRARLVRALGREDAVAVLCDRPARVVLTLTHVDVTFALDHHPIEVRIAGLDRDLGWIPAAGRYVAFHFE